MSTPDFFRSRLDQIIDLRHPLAVLATRLPWGAIEAAVAPKLAHQARPAKRLAGADLAGTYDGEFGGGISPAGRPRLPVRLMASLLYLKNSFNLSDEELVERWAEKVQWQFFGGMDYYEPRLPCDATQIGRFRRLLGEDGIEQLLKATIDCAVQIRAVKPTELERVIVDSTVQSKAIAHPVDSRLLEIARHKLVATAKRAGINLKQTYAQEGKALRRKAGGYELCARQAVQTPSQDGQAPAHHPRGGDARGAAQAGRRPGCGGR
jgi:IS5 family transposase